MSYNRIGSSTGYGSTNFNPLSLSVRHFQQDSYLGKTSLAQLRTCFVLGITFTEYFLNVPTCLYTQPPGRAQVRWMNIWMACSSACTTFIRRSHFRTIGIRLSYKNRIRTDPYVRKVVTLPFYHSPALRLDSRSLPNGSTQNTEI